jgi:hypothetical protein
LHWNVAPFGTAPPVVALDDVVAGAGVSAWATPPCLEQAPLAVFAVE